MFHYRNVVTTFIDRDQENAPKQKDKGQTMQLQSGEYMSYSIGYHCLSHHGRRTRLTVDEFHHGNPDLLSIPDNELSDCAATILFTMFEVLLCS